MAKICQKLQTLAITPYSCRAGYKLWNEWSNIKIGQVLPSEISKEWYNHANMLNMLKLKTSPNHSKSLILGSRDSFSSKNNSNRLTLQAISWKFTEMCPVSAWVKIFFILTLHTYRQSLGWPLTTILTSQPIHEMCSSPTKTSYVFSIYEKTVSHKNSWKVSFGSYRGLLQIPIDIGPMSLILLAINGQFVFQPENG